MWACRDFGRTAICLQNNRMNLGGSLSRVVFEWELNDKGGVIVFGVEPQPSQMRLNQSPRDTEAQARSPAHLFRREKRLHELLLNFNGDAGS